MTARRARMVGDVSDYTSIYAIGDVHGCFAELTQLQDRIIEDAKADKGFKLLVLLGDYIDRGPRSRQVLDYLCAPPPPDFARVALCGNHDDSFLRFLKNPRDNRSWLEHGGIQTLYSYGVDAGHILRSKGVDALAAEAREAVPQAHVELLESMPILLTIGPLVFVHAGIRPGVALEEQSDGDLMWIREPFLSQGPQLPMLVVHGHSPSTDTTVTRGRIGIDTGAYATGKLTALKISEGRAKIL